MGEKKLYRAIEDAIDGGIVRSSGISNYYTEETVLRMTREARIMPSVIQNENHIYYQNTTLQEQVLKHGIVLESYFPLGGRGRVAESTSNDRIVALSKKYAVSPEQIIIRWHMQSGYIVIPGSGNPEHIEENIDVFHFSLIDEDMKHIAALNTGKRYVNW